MRRLVEPGQSVGGGELGEAAVELGQLILHPLAFGDIADDADKFRLRGVARFRRQLELAFDPRQRSVGAVGPEHDRADAIDPAQPCRCRPDAFLVLGMNQVEA